MEKTKRNLLGSTVWVWFFFFAVGVHAQETSSFGEEDWDVTPKEQVDLGDFFIQDFKDNPSFSYYEEMSDESLWERVGRWPGILWSRLWDWILAGEEATGIAALFIKALPWVAVAGMLVVLVWVLANLERDATGREVIQNSQVRVLAEEDLIHHAAIDQLIDQAIAVENYPLAVRYYYLQALQLLTQKGMINWQDQKTNADYIREIPKGNLKETFVRVTAAYDAIWYGKFEVDKLLFSRTVQSFERLKALI